MVHDNVVGSNMLFILQSEGMSYIVVNKTVGGAVRELDDYSWGS